MKAIVLPLLAGAAAVLCGCEKKLPSDPPAPLPVQSAPAESASTDSAAAGPDADGMVGVMEVSSEETGAPSEVVAEAQIDLDPQTLENQRVKAEVLARIDVMPELSPEEKDKLYVQVERARAMGKVITIPFPSGRSSLNARDSTALGEELKAAQVASLTEDPTVVFVVLGFADKKGDPAKNIEISLLRANSVVQALKNQFRVMNVMHAVGMGSSEMFDAENLDKNRVVELWAVLP